jgi:GNAT superfamily N-acetyltransferase
MILPDGCSDVAAGKIAAVITHLEMTERSAPRPDPEGACTLRSLPSPALDWFRDLYRRVGEEWLWFSRLQMADAELAAIIRSPMVEVHALVHEWRDEGLLELDFRKAGQCELAFFGVTADLIGGGAGRWLMNRALELAWCGRSRASGCTPARSIIPPRWRSALGLSSVPAADRDRRRPAAGWNDTAERREACSGHRMRIVRVSAQAAERRAQ